MFPAQFQNNIQNRPIRAWWPLEWRWHASWIPRSKLYETMPFFLKWTGFPVRYYSGWAYRAWQTRSPDDNRPRRDTNLRCLPLDSTKCSLMHVKLFWSAYQKGESQSNSKSGQFLKPLGTGCPQEYTTSLKAFKMTQKCPPTLTETPKWPILPASARIWRTSLPLPLYNEAIILMVKPHDTR